MDSVIICESVTLVHDMLIPGEAATFRCQSVDYEIPFKNTQLHFRIRRNPSIVDQTACSGKRCECGVNIIFTPDFWIFTPDINIFTPSIDICA